MGLGSLNWFLQTLPGKFLKPFKWPPKKNKGGIIKLKKVGEESLGPFLIITPKEFLRKPPKVAQMGHVTTDMRVDLSSIEMAHLE